MNHRFLMLWLCLSLCCLGFAQRKIAKRQSPAKQTTAKVQTNTNHPPMNSPIVNELKKIDYAGITEHYMLTPNCATEHEDDGTIPVDETQFSHVKDIITKDVIAANSLEEGLNTPLKKKHYMESEEYKTAYEFLLAERTCILDHEYFIESDFDSQFDLDSQTFSFRLYIPNWWHLRIWSDDSQCSIDRTFTTTKMSEDLAYQIETNKVKTFLVVKLGDQLYEGHYIKLIPQRIYLASITDGKILYEYKFSQKSPEEISDISNQKENSSGDDVSTEESDNAYVYVEEMPKYPDGDMGLFRSLSQNLVYPAKALKEGTQGTVLVKFVVEEDGSIGETVVARSLSPECDQAAVDAIKKLERFTPGKQNGEPVRVWFAVPVRFQIQ